MLSKSTEAAAPFATSVVPGAVLDEDAVRQFITSALAAAELDGRSVCVIVPDGTRSCPLPLLLSAVHQALHGRASRITVLVALGTHAAMSERAAGQAPRLRPGHLDDRYPGVDGAQPRVVGPGDLRVARLASAPTGSRELSDGLLAAAGGGRLNRAVVEHDVSLVVGRCSRTRSSGSPAATSTSSRASPGRRSSTSRTGWAP